MLNPGENRDGKRSIRTKQQGLIRWLLKEHAIETHILATLTEDDRLSILAPKGGQARVNELFRRVNDRIISRNAIETVARQLDPMKRMRDARLELEDEGIRILGHQDGDPDEARRLGLPVPNKGEAIATRRT